MSMFLLKDFPIQTISMKGVRSIAPIMQGWKKGKGKGKERKTLPVNENKYGNIWEPVNGNTYLRPEGSACK